MKEEREEIAEKEAEKEKKGADKARKARVEEKVVAAKAEKELGQERKVEKMMRGTTVSEAEDSKRGSRRALADSIDDHTKAKKLKGEEEAVVEKDLDDLAVKVSLE